MTRPAAAACTSPVASGPNAGLGTVTVNWTGPRPTNPLDALRCFDAAATQYAGWHVLAAARRHSHHRRPVHAAVPAKNFDRALTSGARLTRRRLGIADRLDLNAFGRPTVSWVG